jgi:hypothetical protein
MIKLWYSKMSVVFSISPNVASHVCNTTRCNTEKKSMLVGSVLAAVAMVMVAVKSADI